jgi:NDP-sugar pyrophosphorylase family protein
MGALTADTPKLLLEVAGRPYAAHQLEWLAGCGVERVVLCVGHLSTAIRDFVGDGSEWGVEVSYVDEGSRLLGTAGALRLAHDGGLLEDAFGVLYGDSYLRFDLAGAFARFRSEGRAILMCVLRNEGRWDSSNATVEDGVVTRYEKGVADPAAAGLDHIDYGFSVIDRDRVIGRLESGRVADLATIYAERAAAGEIAAFEVGERFYEIGSPEGLAELDGKLSDAARRP